MNVTKQTCYFERYEVREVRILLFVHDIQSVYKRMVRFQKLTRNLFSPYTGKTYTVSSSNCPSFYILILNLQCVHLGHTTHIHTIIEFVPYSMCMWLSPFAALPIQRYWRTRLGSSRTFLWKWGEHHPVAECNF
jgi:hypothetical protein